MSINLDAENMELGELHLFIEDNERFYELCTNEICGNKNHVYYIDDNVIDE